jgi:ribosome recycling factor
MIDFNKEEKNLADTVSQFEGDLKNLRVGRAHISLVEDIMVESYGAKSPISHVASLSSPDQKSILISPWDKSLLPAIASAIEKSGLGVAPVADQDQIRLSFPSMTEERRKETIKVLNKKTEETRILVRKLRDDIWSTIQEDHKEKNISEDQKFSQKEKMEKLVEGINKKIAETAEKKEKEIMEV